MLSCVEHEKSFIISEPDHNLFVQCFSSVFQMGYVKDSYPIEAICLAIWFFPIGLICCLTMKERRCTNCNLRYH